MKKQGYQLKPGDIALTGETIVSVVKHHSSNKILVKLKKDSIIREAIWGKYSTIFLKNK